MNIVKCVSTSGMHQRTDELTKRKENAENVIRNLQLLRSAIQAPATKAKIVTVLLMMNSVLFVL